MRISEYYKLERTQPSLDFIDVDITNDTELFVDPGAIRSLESDWGNRCVSLIQDFFQTVLSTLKTNKQNARNLLGLLHEPNETHLGLSKERSQGHAMSSGLASNVADSLMNSEAVRSGLLQDLEDTVLMVEGIGKDVISDITTNIIRGPLIDYSNIIASQLGIPLQEGISSGVIWDAQKHKWTVRYVSLPQTTNGKILLVPKAIVRRKLDFDPSEYYSQYILPDLAEREINANTELVKLLKDKRKKVYKKDLRKKYGEGKEAIIKLTRETPSILMKYRAVKQRNRSSALSHEELSETARVPQPRWTELLDTLYSIPEGHANAERYHEHIEQILTPLFYPELIYPIKEYSIHNGRKRIDIAYTNIASKGFFHWYGAHHPGANIFIECKNYSGDPANPELDQLSSRFSPSRGRLGILTVRKFTDKTLFMQRCIDTAHDDRGFIIALEDRDIHGLVKAKIDGPDQFFRLLKEKFDALT